MHLLIQLSLARQLAIGQFGKTALMSLDILGHLETIKIRKLF